MDADTIRNKLLAQHDRIRADLAECRALAQRLHSGELVAFDLERAIGQLQSDFHEHNWTESKLLLPLLLHGREDGATRGTRLVERMLEEHVAEHAAVLALLAGPLAEIAANLEELTEQLDAHMAAEERTFLSPLILRDDAVHAATPDDRR